jgi:competence protein ComEA
MITGWWVFSSRPESLPPGAGGGTSAAPDAGNLTATSLAPTPSVPSAAGSSAGSSAAGGQVLVDVEGKVRRPGLYRLPDGARVADALAAAGGARPHVSTVSLNLAARVTDGQQVVVGSAASPAAPGSPAVGGGASSSTAPALVSLNAASLEQLETLPGVGPVLAQHILDWRAEHGGFASVDQLNDVSGIGDITFANLHDLVTL